MVEFGDLYRQPVLEYLKLKEHLANLKQMVSGGCHVEIRSGRLVVEHPEKVIPSNWLAAHEEGLLGAILDTVGLDAFRYQGYLAGHFGSAKAGGVMLHFISCHTGEEVRVTFNADLKRQRRSKGGNKGERLPKGQFYIGGRTAFYKFWGRTGLKRPRKLAEYWCYMGNLKPLLFTAFWGVAGIDKGSLKALNLPCEQIRLALGFADKPQTSDRQAIDSIQTSSIDKRSRPAHMWKGFQGSQSAGFKGAYKVQSMTNEVRSVNDDPVCRGRPVCEQSNDEWLEVYGVGHPE